MGLPSLLRRFALLLPIVLSSWSSSFLALLDMAHYGLLLRRRCQAEGPLHTLALCPSNMLDKHFRILQGEAGSFGSSSGNLPNDKPVVKVSFRMSQIKPWISLFSGSYLVCEKCSCVRAPSVSRSSREWAEGERAATSTGGRMAF